MKKYTRAQIARMCGSAIIDQIDKVTPVATGSETEEMVEFSASIWIADGQRLTAWYWQEKSVLNDFFDDDIEELEWEAAYYTID